MSYHITRGPRGRGAVRARPFARAALGSLGDSATDAAYQTASLAELKNISAWQQRWVLNDERQRWIQIAVTAAIPVFGAAWKLVGKFLSRGE